jgi:YbbR domain-containing protein
MFDILRKSKLKILAVVLAAGTWYIINSQIISEDAEFMLPVKILVAKDMVVTKQVPKNVRITVRGPAGEISKFEQKLYPVEIDLTRQSVPREKEVIISREKIQQNIPSELKILNHLPRHVVVMVDKKIEVKLPVEISIAGRPRYGYKLFKTSVRPQYYKFKAAAAKLENITSIRTEAIDISKVIGSFEQKINLIDPIDNKPLTRQVTAIINIQPEYREKIFKEVPVKLMFERSLDKKVALDPGAIDIMLEGRADEIDKIQLPDISLHITITPDMEGEFQLNPTAYISNKYKTIRIKSDLPAIKVNVMLSI